MSTILSSPSTAATPAPEQSRRSVERLLAPLDELAAQSKNFLSRSFGEFESDGQSYRLPRYVYLGPKGGGDTLRLGIFATIHGDISLAMDVFKMELYQLRNVRVIFNDQNFIRHRVFAMSLNM